MKQFFHIKKKPNKEKKPLSPRMQKICDILNKYSLLFHALLSLFIVFVVEWISRRNFGSAVGFITKHTLAYFYNAFIVFASFMFVYLFRRRTFVRVVTASFWMILGIINGCILSNRVTPFGYTDLKCISDLLSMTNTNYFTATQAVIVVIGLALLLTVLVTMFIKGPKYKGDINYIVIPVSLCAVFFIAIPVTTSAAQSTNVVASYYSNLAQGYQDYGFVYSFSSSVVDRGMNKPEDYSEEEINQIMADVASQKQQTTVTAQDAPNVIFVLLESFVDPYDYNFMTLEKDPIPTFHMLEKNFTTGYCTVPVVGAGTANSEFEALTGMSMAFFGTGEYPYKTTLKETKCEGAGSVFKNLGYATHAVHNNGGNFYSRVNAFSMMGFDTFTSKEMMDITSWNPLGSWASDDILVSETIKTLDATPNQPDFTYTITVGTHGDYPKEPVLDVVNYPVGGIDDEEVTNQWNYYVNQLHEADNFIAGLISELEKRDEKTIVVMFGDHLPTMGLTDEDMKSGDIYKTKYITWNNFGVEKKDADLYLYQLLASTMDSIGIHEGTIFGYHQVMMQSENYMHDLEALQYDLLYGERYAYAESGDIYPATDIVMGVQDVVINSIENSLEDGCVYLHGTNFTNWSKVYVDDAKVTTTYVDGNTLSIRVQDIEDGAIVTVKQLGSSNTVFRVSNEVEYVGPTEEELSQMLENESTETESY